MIGRALRRQSYDLNEQGLFNVEYADVFGVPFDFTAKPTGIIGETPDMDLKHLGDMRPSSLVFHVTQRLLYTKWRDPGEEPKLYLFGQLKRITKQWIDARLVDERTKGRPAYRHESYFFVGRCLPKTAATSFFLMRADGLPR